ncbi:MAG: hypothetical protein GTN53_29230 [Candidatus Aminicenantes bacterium]|nr:hypothetical protein [Candidatus Aminicenantes bacterium]NIQ70557.1 hypothetical protein [Candidatus Aminicenantes bacterium]NIT26598.1 hypothetical protein [Candidatus Aminicenantes bacterium]
MSKKSIAVLALAFLIFLVVNVSVANEEKNARRPAILTGANRVVDLQRTDTGWEGTWYWYVGSTYNATNLTGVTALGLLEAFRDVKDPVYLDAAVDAAGFIMAHLGAGATGTQYHVRTTAPDIVFLQRLSEVTGDMSYAVRATLEWNNLKSFWPTAGDLDALFRAINRRSAWDIAFFMEAAHLSGDLTWADQAAAILADTSDTFYYGTDTWWYALNLGGAIRALVGCGCYVQYQDSILFLLNELIGLCDEVNGVGGYFQDTAYAVLAFNTVGGAARSYANELGRWLASQQDLYGGWIEAGYEYPEVDGEAVRALSFTIGSNVALDGIKPGKVMNSSWRRLIPDKVALPFNGD